MNEANREHSESEPVLTLENLPAALGFIETEELQALRVEGLTAAQAGDWPQIIRFRSQYHKIGEELIEPLDGEERSKAIIGLTVSMALVMRDGGQTNNYGADLANAHLIAWNNRFDKEAALIESAMAQMGREVVMTLPGKKSNRAQPKEYSEEYQAELQKLSERFAAESEPVQVSLDANRLLVNGAVLQVADGPAILWRALTDGREDIEQGLEHYRESIRRPDKTVDPNTPLRLIFLASYPRQVLTEAAMDEVDHFVRDFTNIEDLKPKFKEFWQAVEAAGMAPEVRLLPTRNSWNGVYLWARAREPRPSNQETV